MIDWLAETFSPGKFRWLGDEFIHPSEFKAVYKAIYKYGSLTHLLGGFSTEGR